MRRGAPAGFLEERTVERLSPLGGDRGRVGLRLNRYREIAAGNRAFSSGFSGFHSGFQVSTAILSDGPRQLFDHVR